MNEASPFFVQLRNMQSTERMQIFSTQFLAIFFKLKLEISIRQRNYYLEMNLGIYVIFVSVMPHNFCDWQIMMFQEKYIQRECNIKLRIILGNSSRLNFKNSDDKNAHLSVTNKLHICIDNVVDEEWHRFQCVLVKLNAQCFKNYLVSQYAVCKSSHSTLVIKRRLSPLTQQYFY